MTSALQSFLLRQFELPLDVLSPLTTPASSPPPSPQPNYYAESPVAPNLMNPIQSAATSTSASKASELTDESNIPHFPSIPAHQRAEQPPFTKSTEQLSFEKELVVNSEAQSIPPVSQKKILTTRESPPGIAALDETVPFHQSDEESPCQLEDTREVRKSKKRKISEADPQEMSVAYEEPLEPIKSDLRPSISKSNALKLVSPKASGAIFSQTSKSRIQNSTCWVIQLRKELKCCACRKKKGPDTCRFIGIRMLHGPKSSLTASFLSQQEQQQFQFPREWNIPFTSAHRCQIKRAVIPALLPTLEKELTHLSDHTDIIQRHRETALRATCDMCLTSLFCGTWMCRRCGREACSECFEKIKKAYQNYQQQCQSDPYNPVRLSKQIPHLFTCHSGSDHSVADFVPVSRFHEGQLQTAITEMRTLLAHSHLPIVNSLYDSTSTVTSPKDNNAIVDRQLDPDGCGSHRLLSVSQTSTLRGTPSSLASPTGSTIPGDPVETEVYKVYTEALPVPNQPLHAYSSEGFTDAIFRDLWASHTPFAVQGLLHHFQIEWTPRYIIEHYGMQPCTVVDCETEAPKSMTVKDFFDMFGKIGTRPWKLKDWPPTEDFKTAFPELFEDFHRAIPAPDYTRRDGVVNLAAHFPLNAISPDVGPKMYGALASTDTLGTKGTTRLHMDMADAVNIMLYAEDCPNGSPGFAIWDIFRAEDSNKLRTFLRNKFHVEDPADPIHLQQHYLDNELRTALYHEHGVFSLRIYQYPGQAIFIPAGCPHQVLNMADCIKVAIDFVSPENISHCETLTREFRNQNYAICWKEDVLQLKTMMWFAWLSCSRYQD